MNEKKPRKRKLSDVIGRLETGATPPDPAMSAIVAGASPASTAVVVAPPLAVARPASAVARPAPVPAPKRKSGVWGIAALVAIVLVLMVAGPAVLVVFANPFLAVIFGLAIWKLWDLS